MKKILLAITLVIISKLSASQVNTTILNCKSPFEGEPQFTVQFNNLDASVKLKGYTHKARYLKSWLGKNGDTWMEYSSVIIVVSVTPEDNYVTIRSVEHNTIISSGYCK